MGGSKKNTDLAPVTNLTPEETALAKANYLTALVNSGGLVSEAVVAAGCDPQQLYKWRERDEQFRKMEEFAQVAVDDSVRAQIRDLVALGNEKMIALAAKRLPEYQPKSVKDINISGLLTHEHVRKMDESERALLISEAHGLIEDADVEGD